MYVSRILKVDQMISTETRRLINTSFYFHWTSLRALCCCLITNKKLDHTSKRNQRWTVIICFDKQLIGQSFTNVYTVCFCPFYDVFNGMFSSSQWVAINNGMYFFLSLNTFKGTYFFAGQILSVIELFLDTCHWFIMLYEFRRGVVIYIKNGRISFLF